MPPFEHHPEDALHLIQYRPHHNCRRVEKFVGFEPACGIDGDDMGSTTVKFAMPDGALVNPGDFISERPDGSFEVVTADDLLDYIKGTTGTWLEA